MPDQDVLEQDENEQPEDEQPEAEAGEKPQHTLDPAPPPPKASPRKNARQRYLESIGKAHLVK